MNTKLENKKYANKAAIIFRILSSMIRNPHIKNRNNDNFLLGFLETLNKMLHMVSSILKALKCYFPF